MSSLSDEARFNEQAPLIITKTNSRSPIHRSGYMDYIGVLRFDKKGNEITPDKIKKVQRDNGWRQD